MAVLPIIPKPTPVAVPDDVANRSDDNRIVIFDPGLSFTERESIHNWFMKRAETLPVPSGYQRISGELPAAFIELEKALDRIALASGFNPATTAIRKHFALTRPGVKQFVSEWHKDPMVVAETDPDSEYQFLTILYSPFEPGPEILIDDPDGVPYDLKNRRPIENPTEVEMAMGTKVLPPAFANESPNSGIIKPEAGLAVGFDLVRQPWHRMPSRRETLLFYQYIQKRGTGGQCIL